VKFDNASRGLLWTGIEKILVQGVGFVQGIVLARLLCPADFGLTAMLGIFLAVAGIFADSGFGVALVQDRTFTREDERKVMCFGLAVSGSLYAVLFFAAPYVAAFYAEPRLIAILRVLALTLVLGAPCGIASARLQRTERFGPMARANTMASLLIAGCAVSLAWLGCGVWTLVWASVTGAAARTVLMWGMAWGIAAPGETPSPGNFVRLLRYGWKLAASYLLSTVYGSVIPLVIGKMQTPTAVGLYARASTWSLLPGNIVTEMTGRVSFPKMVESRDRADELRRVRNRFAWLGMALQLPALAVLWLFTKPIIGFVFGSQWIDCVPYLRILIVGAVWWPLSNQNGVALGACGRSDYVLKADLIRRPVGFAVLAAGCSFGVVGLCWAKVLADFIDWMVVSAFVRKVTGKPFLREAVAL